MAGKDGDGSYQKLIVNVYGMNKTNVAITLNYKEYSYVKINGIMMQLFITSINIGYYDIPNGFLNNRGDLGIIWGNNISSNKNALYLDSGSKYLVPQRYANKGMGVSVRCVAKSLPIAFFYFSHANRLATRLIIFTTYQPNKKSFSRFASGLFIRRMLVKIGLTHEVFR